MYKSRDKERQVVVVVEEEWNEVKKNEQMMLGMEMMLSTEKMMEGME